MDHVEGRNETYAVALKAVLAGLRRTGVPSSRCMGSAQAPPVLQRPSATGPQHGKGPCSSRAGYSAAAGAQPPSEQQSATQRAIERVTAGSLSGTAATTKLRTCTPCDTCAGEPGVITGAREERAQ